MRIVRFQPEHLKRLRLQPTQEYLTAAIDNPTYGPALALAGPAFTAFIDDVAVGCGGVVEFGKHRAEVWALLSVDIGPHMRKVTRAVNGWFSQAPYPRLEANVATHFDAGQRWVRLLGFHQEGAEKFKFFEDGQSALSFVRFKD